jgi:hypothetical protein
MLYESKIRKLKSFFLVVSELQTFILNKTTHLFLPVFVTEIRIKFMGIGRGGDV